MIRPIVDLPLLVLATLALLALVVYGLVWSRRTGRAGWLLRAVMVLLLLGIGLRPGLGSMPAPTVVSPLEVVVAVDRTTSMSARDWNGRRSRLDGVRRDVADLLDALPSGRLTLVTFGRSVRTQLPSTQDETLIAETLALIRRETVFGGVGSRLDRPLDQLARMLARMQETNPDRPRILVLAGDGENTDPGTQRSFAPLEPFVDAGVVLGYGTTSGGLMPLEEDRPTDGSVVDLDTGAPARSVLDEDNLRDVAEQLGIDFVHRTGPGGLDDVAAAWNRSFTERGAETGQDVPARHELHWLLALALFLVVLLDLRHHWRRLLQARGELA